MKMKLTTYETAAAPREPRLNLPCRALAAAQGETLPGVSGHRSLNKEIILSIITTIVVIVLFLMVFF